MNCIKYMVSTVRLPLISTGPSSLFVKGRWGGGWHRLAHPGPGPGNSSHLHLETPIICTPTACPCRKYLAQVPQKNWFWLEPSLSCSKETPLALSAQALRTLIPDSFPSKWKKKVGIDKAKHALCADNQISCQL